MAAPGASLLTSIGCPKAFNRKMSLYFTAPLGLAATILSYSQHQSDLPLAGGLLGVGAVLASTWRPMAAYRMPLTMGGCATMIGAQLLGNKIAKETETQCLDTGKSCSNKSC
mmetsp:Transcript_59049/g.104953  ORF Transcript_59049/g.104953 Transcript_59049/m.104953 type:complete len:112 (+) Transcript_59049:231-566(+)|eukprot:CAMPEP_0197690924 /NCGR_PEP_ID=MMETSP1338-20131121/109026_1 /TAXON_ID=43686 ORGANISM="Pelagodinium beii, Strain RCC1491" /NCGR_SAMPLE_ID=MMETSP1338 /ASSEMBLY_ACC=CAM_ASM_000754 /LENGTH=111 /DNA_ID=CAMNT_0043273423 /DNA_START=147 /DNA_END=482 /DNA_ORIENTATION=-